MPDKKPESVAIYCLTLLINLFISGLLHVCGFPVWVLALLLFSIPVSTTLYNSPFYYGPFLSEKSSNFPNRGSILSQTPDVALR